MINLIESSAWNVFWVPDSDRLFGIDFLQCTLSPLRSYSQLSILMLSSVIAMLVEPPNCVVF